MVKFTIYGDIVSAMRPRASLYGGHAHIYQPKENTQYQNLVSMSYKEATSEYFTRDKALNITIHAYFKYPNAMTPLQRELAKKGLFACLKHKDLDNIAKNILDGLNGVAYDDDKQIIDLHIDKKYDEQEHVEVIIEEAPSYNDIKLPISIRKDYKVYVDGYTCYIGKKQYEYVIISVYNKGGELLLEYNTRDNTYRKYKNNKIIEEKK